MAEGDLPKKKRTTTHPGSRSGSPRKPGSRERTTGTHDRQTFVDGPPQSGNTGRHASSDSITADGTGSMPWEKEALEESEEIEQDEDGEDFTGERDYPIPEGWDLDDLTNEEFWTKVFLIEHAFEEGGVEAGKAALRKAGFLSEGHFEFVRERFTETHGGDTNFPQSMMDARRNLQHAQLRLAVGAELLEPIEGISIETYATIQARRRVLPATAGAFVRLLEDYDLTEKVWTRIDALWQARINDPANASAANSVAGAYRKHYAEAAQRFKGTPR
ncbi:MAG: hypothetical protein QM765_19255 [Myxococcales bacterium]